MVAYKPSDEEMRARKKRKLQEYSAEEGDNFDEARMGEMLERRLKVQDKGLCLDWEVKMLQETVACRGDTSGYMSKRLR
jgi:hypothetical protein